MAEVMAEAQDAAKAKDPWRTLKPQHKNVQGSIAIVATRAHFTYTVNAATNTTPGHRDSTLTYKQAQR